MKDPIRIMLVEDHPAYREVIERAIKRATNLNLVSQFGTAEIALRNAQELRPESVPDVILLDLHLPGMSGLESIPWFKKYIPKSEILVLTQSDNESDIHAAISSGASGYLLKSATVTQIKEAIQTVADGGASLDPNVARFILDKLKTLPTIEKPERSLSERELEILTLLGDGLVKKEIADKLNISITTVAYHVKHIYEKLNVMNAPAAIAKAFKTGILSADE
ncbi:response regulator transcription factor [Pelagicoccus sp. SDUM812005]|uniref:response regulator transcription factor n=1 Tax=Pelagicoccus sp. SDUM812005 TaxID=3041257 RepID=UPI00280E95A5|nr:response regulator transcription factor [Pelagicoccus sp. SDUM812005]MDQ8183565.1 response regulator transcription factor [Pelagicoccus sp. SDUM812005]